MNRPPLLEGLVAAVFTPFKPDGSLNLGIVEKQAAHLLRTGVRGAFVGGTTGESSSLTVEERRQLAAEWCQSTRGTALKVVVHTGANCLADACALAADAERLGADAIAAVAPSYFRPPALELLVACSARIAAAAPNTPFYYYDIPGMTGISFSMPEFLEKAPAHVPTFAGLKLSRPDLVTLLQCLESGNGRWEISWGVDEWLLGALATGVRGAVGSSYNFAAPLYRGLSEAFARGDFASARVAQSRSVKLIALLSRHGYMGAAKAVMSMLGIDVGPARLPNASLADREVNILRQELETLGFFDWIATAP